ncbi:heat-inducible transcriptional repressor HrcA [Clostridium gasigenes]|uniref:Heat-inducible transcription repressor HrcA n=1 Tax=Clostridium gasigenes TaxID=94869 RepID=A0A1H0TW26_9CLOT|nr:heat-inducible transcriptional repressor HrcA [Clostridium gasigenes]MBB6624288.1 heat-inducible transcriptional repressor HrcA [Clostridium gasigenes]MBB6714676.1 heat-inducible transcriptional repressor HrcA [Clostridium gasigenes]MBU3089257.1 heat-inducible transcriptional repressor HrcA [Clostridium gasigenes]MBU3105252.1 heat-inducible transcriptional repressor HrcA [Clostridium gasigenes]MBU3109385.1 heat-inducible transcriptional repressor HrcA [Clostridium gasigenes]
MAIDERKIKVLQAIINDYISTGEPVGSRTLAKKYDLGVGSATIRNEMADLEELGYLEQPHTSAGRIPSSKGYRLYVDSLMEVDPLTLQEELRIKEYIINSALYEVDKIVKQASTLLSELTNLTCIVQTPSVRKSYIKSIQLLKIDNHNLVLVVVTQSGLIKNNRIRVVEMPEQSEFQRINEVLQIRLKNLTIEEINLEVINSLKIELTGYDEIFNGMLPALYETLSQSESTDILVEGTTNIFNYPEYNNIDKAKEIISLLNNKDCVIELLEQSGDISVKIGDENFFPGAKECSIISAEYSLGGNAIGTIGLIGPRRINYSKVIAIMAQVMKELNKSITNQRIE